MKSFKNLASPLQQMQTLKEQGVRKEGLSFVSSKLAVILPLTSLIDAFCIIVIYLLIGTQSGGVESKVPDQLTLPVAESGLSLTEEIPTVRIQSGIYYINDECVEANQLVAKLVEVKNKILSASATVDGSKPSDVQIMIQADQKMNYALLDPLLRAGSAAGIQKLKFAVTPTR